MQYQLNINFDDAGVEMIYASGQFVTIVKRVASSSPSGSELPVAWLTFQPLESNRVTWQDALTLYASSTRIQAGAMINVASTSPSPVKPGQAYGFQNGSFNTSAGGPGSGITVINESYEPLSFGLMQEAQADGTAISAPLNAVPILVGEQATFTPEETVLLFLSNAVNNGTVFNGIPPMALSVTLTPQEPVANISFNDSNATFYLASMAT